MGLLADIGNWIAEQFKKITDWIRDVLASAIEELRVWIQLRKHDFKIWLANFVSTTGGFWTVVAVVIAGVVLTAWVGQTAWYIATVASINGVIEKIKNGAGNILARIGYSLINTTHNILLLLNDDYKAAWQVFYTNLAALSDELRLGVSTINVAIRNARTICYSAMIFAGFSEADATAWFANSSTSFMSKLEDRFERYTRNPELIFQDIDDEIVAPMIELMQSGTTEVLGEIAGAYDLINEKALQLQTLKGSFDTFIEGFPDEVSAALAKQWADTSKKFDDFYTKYVEPVQKVGNVLVDQFTKFVESQDAKIAALVEKYETPGDMLAAILLLPEPFRTMQLNRVKAVFELAGYYETLQAAQDQARQLTLESGKVDNIIERLNRVYKPHYVSPSGSSRQLQRTTFDTWYVGGY